jgi:DNA topoisomerase-1
MAKNLVIVESPAKAKTINRYLGPDYVVKASLGHIRDLPKTRMGVDVRNDFAPEYKIIPARKKVVDEIRKAAGRSSRVLLAADPDREGEAICWHLASVLQGLNPEIYRMLLHEITRPAVEEALENLQQLDQGKVEAQQTRRILDRLVGYGISPLLWKKIGRGLSAGRVQSIALRLICEREKEIRDFVVEEYWTIAAQLEAARPPSFKAQLLKIEDKKVKIGTGDEAAAVKQDLEKQRFLLRDVQVKAKVRNPSPPYITSTLQQEGFRQLHFSVKKTMSVAQRLYEGLEIGGRGSIGLITYMRTDSVRLSDEALRRGREFIASHYPPEYLPTRARHFKNKKKAQDAHEAIRPTSFDLPPEALQQYLDKDSLRLYSMIWTRFIASQMSPARVEETEFDIRAGRYQLRAKGEVVKFDGFLRLFPRLQKDEKILPTAEPGEALKLLGVETTQNFTKPPPRYSEGSLVKELEARGIGRPSTYAPIIATLLNRDYVIREKGRFIPQELGMFVTDYLIAKFPDLMQFEFTAQLEEKLDLISEGRENGLTYLKSYYTLLDEDLKRAEADEGFKGKGIPSEDVCPECGRNLVIKEGRFGRFKACSGYPDCTYRQSLEKKETRVLEEACPRCGAALVERRGRYGPFIACSDYPKCRYVKSDTKDTGIACPECADGTIVRRKTRQGKIFYGCSRYPKCRFATWDEPVDRSCPECGRSFLLRKSSKKGGTYLTCSSKDCSFREEEDGAEDSASNRRL